MIAGWVALALFVATLILVALVYWTKSRVRHAEDNMDVAFFTVFAVLFGAATVICLIVWLAIT